ncbi:MAG: Gx transporter family protein [Spirochaetes bacterium]|nr:Gx transporter family protein [Spirochaetota bacterium]
MNNKTQKIAYFAGLSAFIGVFENFIPVPIPFLRLGLSNIPVCLSFTIFNFFECLFIVLFKVVFTHLFRGTLFSYPFLIGLCGNLVFILIGYPFYQLLKKHISFISLGIVGAFSHNFGQILAASLFIPVKPLFYFGILLITIGIFLGFINGIICNIIHNKIFVRYFNE